MILGNLGPQAAESYQQFLQPYDEDNFQNLFEQAFINPAMAQYEQRVLPAVQQRFENLNAGSSSALNQALAQSATDLSTMLGTQMGQFYQQQQANQLAALGQLGALSGINQFQPMIQERQGILGPLIQAGGQIGGAYMRSSALVKENVAPYQHGMDYLKEMDVFSYNYKPEAKMGEERRVGFIAEAVPEELQLTRDGVTGVDMYALLAVAVNAVKELENRVRELEAR